MPIGFSSEDVAAIQLDCVDKDKPQRATFRFRFLTAAETKRVQALRKEAWDAAGRDNEKADAKLNEAINLGLVGWDSLSDGDGKPVPFTPDSLDAFMIRTKFQMVDEYPYALMLTGPEKKA